MKSKIYDTSNERASDLKLALHRHFTRDGTLNPQEQTLLLMAEEACAESRMVATRIRFAVRGLGGGRCHKSLRMEARSLVRLADELEALSGPPSCEHQEQQEQEQEEAA